MIVSSKTRQQVAEEYDISRKTLFRRLKEKGFDFGKKLLGPDQLLLIYCTLGIPPKMLKEEQEFYRESLNKV